MGAEAILYRVDQRDRRDRFPQHAGEIRRVDLLGGSGHDHDRKLGKVRCDFAADVAATKARQSEVEHNCHRRAPIDLPECRDAVICSDHGVARDLQSAPVERAERWIILDDKDLRMDHGVEAASAQHMGNRNR